MKYSGVACYTSDDIKKLESEPFTKYFLANSGNQQTGYGYYEYSLKDSKRIVESNPELCYARKGHIIYKYENGKMVRQNLYPLTAKQHYKSLKKHFRKIDYYNNKYKELHDKTVVNRRLSIFGFKRLRYCSGTANYTLPFALYKPRKSAGSLPLVIFLHGYTNGGEENIVPFTQCLDLVNKIKRNIKNKPCMILVPSIPKYSSFFTPKDGSNNSFEDNFNGLFNKLIKEYPIDKNRVYIIGSSNGAGGTWSQLRLHPKRYAAAIPMMGWCDDLSDNFFKSIKDVAVWAVHAEDDDNVKIGEMGNGLYGSDYLVDGLKKAKNRKIRYSRYNKHGHSAAEFFLKNEDWYSWLFEQTR